MRLSAYSDYSFRVLMLAALRSPNRITVNEVAETFNLSRNHLVKVVHGLGQHGYLATHRGSGGGFTLGRAPEDIKLGDVVRLGEETEAVITCEDRVTGQCRIYPACGLRSVLDEASGAFFSVLDSYSLADLINKPARLKHALAL